MKKRYLALALAGIILGYVAKVNYWFEDEREIYFPITKEQIRSKVRAEKLARLQSSPIKNQISTVTSAPSVAPHADLSKLSQNLLFNEIYKNKVLQHESHHSLYFQMIQARLNSQYPQSPSGIATNSYEREVENRLGLLRAMSHFWSNPTEVKNVDPKQIKNFFYSVAKNKNENIMVRRQAYKNWLTFGEHVADSQKHRLAQNSDRRLLHLVSFSDESLIESLTHSEQ